RGRAVFIFGLGLPAVDTFLQQVINGLTAGSVYAVVALGYTMVYGIIQLINFAHGEVVMIGAMVAFTVINALAPGGLPPLVVVLVGTACAIPVCMLVGYSMARRAAPGAAHHRDRRIDPPAAPGDAGVEPQRAGVPADHPEHDLYARRRIDHERADRHHRGMHSPDGRARAARIPHAARHRDARYCAKPARRGADGGRR